MQGTFRILSRFGVGMASICASVAGLSSAADPPIFSNRVYAVPGENYFIKAGDFNGDGLPDVATTNSNTHDLSVLFGDGRGGLAPEIRVDVPYGPFAVGDFNRDGFDDLAVVSYATDEVVVRIGHGDGTFGEPMPVPVGDGPRDIVAADFNGDGIVDLAVTNFASGDVSVLLGRGDGAFLPEMRSPVGPGPNALTAGEFNGDGRRDLAVLISPSSEISILLGVGDGTFDAGSLVSNGAYHRAIASGDLDGDGRDELATADSLEASVFPNAGDGTFGKAVTYYPGGDVVFQVAITDVTGDGKRDLIESAHGGAVFPGRGDGTFGPRATFGGGPLPFGFAVGDFDRDGKEDLATANGYRSSVSVLLGNGDGTSGTRFGVGRFPLGIARADFDGDGRSDLLTFNEDSGDVSVLLGTDRGGFAPERRTRVGAIAPGVFAAGDLDADGRQDVAVGDWSLRQVQLAYGKGDGTFDPIVPFLPSARPNSLAIGDVDGDGKADLVFSVGTDTIEVDLSLGGGAFAPPILSRVGEAGYLRLTDWNGDGHTDLVVTSVGRNRAAVLLGDGAGGFQEVWKDAFSLDQTVYATSGDVDGDGIVDLLMAGSGGFSVSLGRGDGTFGPQTPYETDGYSSFAVVGDFNGDGLPDVATTFSGDDIGVFLGTGGGALTLQGRYDGGNEESDAVVGDFDGDGKLDLAIAASFSEVVTVLFNRFDREPVARAGADQVLECDGGLTATAHLDGSSSSDADSTPGTNDDIAGYAWSEGSSALASTMTASVPFHLGAHDVTLAVTDKAGATEIDHTLITVQDTKPPIGAIVAPPAKSCFGPAALPVIVTDDITDVCDPTVLRSYDPAPGPSYSRHGDYHVTLTAKDTSSNAATAAVDFTIDTKPPVVELSSPPEHALLIPSGVPFSVVFRAGDDDGAAGGVVHEVVKLQGCTIYDGLTYGNRDGLLSDESLAVTGTELCRLAAACGFTTLSQPELRVEATDCGGNVGVASHRFAGSIALRPGLCGN
jgi:hypothetical protein